MRIGPAIAALALCFLAGLAAATFALGGVPTPDPPPQATVTGTGTTTGTTGTSTTGTTETAPPLTVTPPVGSPSYLFPIAGPTQWGDSYGAPRPDVPSGWHHGDDLFAALGTPVVAVADGTVGDVGWERLGGWRLWLTDGAGNQFYYAHLSGFTEPALRGGSVHAGDVLGFVGNTGDADGGAYHLHFEIHPASLRSLGEDGAVDPTSYLASWRRLESAKLAKPVLPALPDGAVGDRARASFAALLAVPAIKQALAPPVRRPRVIHRGIELRRAGVRRWPAPLASAAALASPAPRKPVRKALVRMEAPAAAKPAATSGSSSSLRVAGVAAAAALAVVVVLVPLGLRRRLRRR